MSRVFHGLCGGVSYDIPQGESVVSFDRILLFNLLNSKQILYGNPLVPVPVPFVQLGHREAELFGENIDFLLSPVILDTELELKEVGLLFTQSETPFFVGVHEIILAIQKNILDHQVHVLRLGAA